ncbi:MAG: NEW3 domain-containing protein [Candidatus Bipolaricaulaceae bacterium]
MKRSVRIPRLTALAFLVLLAGLSSHAQDRGLAFYTDYPAVVIGQGDKVSLEIKLHNSGSIPENVTLSASGPEGWNPRFETTSYPTMRVKGVHLLPGAEEPREVKFKADPPEDAPAGEYEFTLSAATADGEVQRTVRISVTLEAEPVEETEEVAEILQLAVDYPALESAAGEEFTFNVQIKNQSDQDQVVELAAQAPLGWRAYFSPRWEQETRITSIKVNGGATQNVRFVVSPPYGVEKGEYPLTFVAAAGDYQATLDLKAVVTGTYDLQVASEAEVTGTGDTWNIKAVEGRDRHYTLYLYNKGSAPINSLRFYATKPEGWEVSFDPESLEQLTPFGETRELAKVDVAVTPPDRAIPGDYQVRLTASGREDQASAQLRVTVGAAMGWGWIGVGVVVVVIAALTGVFVRLGRR